MPRSNNPTSYPHTFFTILRDAEKLLPLEIEQDTLKDAQRLRFVWYDFRRALTKAKHVLEPDALRISVSTREAPGGRGIVRFEALGADVGEALMRAIEAKLGRSLEVDKTLRDPEGTAVDAGLAMMMAINPPNATPKKSALEDFLNKHKPAPQVETTPLMPPDPEDDFIVDGFARTTGEPKTSGNEEQIPPPLSPQVPDK